MRGLIGKKIGMSQVYNGRGHLVPVSIIEVGPCKVTQVKYVEKDGMMLQFLILQILRVELCYCCR